MSFFIKSSVLKDAKYYCVKNKECENCYFFWAEEEKSKAQVFLNVLATNKKEYLDPSYGVPIPGTPQNFKIYIANLKAGKSKGVVRIMLCRLLRKVLQRFPVINVHDRTFLNACGSGPTGSEDNYAVLVGLYMRMGFEPCGVYTDEDLKKIQRIILEPEFFKNKELMNELDCDLFLQQSIKNLFHWCAEKDI